MAKGKRETTYHIVLSEFEENVPFSVLEIDTAAAFKKWKRRVGLHLNIGLIHTGYLYGKIASGQTCYIVKGKVVVPVDGVTL